MKRIKAFLKCRYDTYISSLSRGEKILRLVLFILTECLSAAVLALLLYRGLSVFFAVSIHTFFFIAVPPAFEYFFSCKMRVPAFIFMEIFSLCPMVGKVLQLYAHTVWFDKLLHLLMCATLVFLGMLVFPRLFGKGHKTFAAVVFSVCLSAAVASAWEIFEFMMDRFCGMDMQMDTVIHSIYSSLLGEGAELYGGFSGITDVTVNGAKLPIDGYLDIGLFDSMLDMLSGWIGSAAAAIYCLADRGRHPPVSFIS